MSEGLVEQLLSVRKICPPLIHGKGIPQTLSTPKLKPTDWRYPIRKYHQTRNPRTSRKVKVLSLNYLLMGDELYRKRFDSLLLRFVGLEESIEIMKQGHKDVSGAHRSSIKMRYLIRRHGFYWPTILQDCIKYSKWFRAC